MTEVYLFDWGDTLMVDFPGEAGKMCDWDKVEAVDGAEEALKYISTNAKVYIATSAGDSTEADIKAAFERVGLDKYISGYFCKENVGIEKGTPEFLTAILNKLGKKPDQVTMVGDNLEKDLKPAISLGIKAIWLSSETSSQPDTNISKIASLRELST